MTAEKLYELSRRPGDPPWWELPYHDADAIEEHGCFGKQHWVALVNNHRSETMHINDGEHDYGSLETRAYGVDWTNVDHVYGPARGYGVPNRDEQGNPTRD